MAIQVKPIVGTNRAFSHSVGSRLVRCRAEQPQSGSATESSSAPEASEGAPKVKVASDKNVKAIAQTFAPRASGNTGKNPAVKGSVLYDIFTYQAWICLAAGGLLSFNIAFPSDQPDIWRLMGMWSIWMFTVPSLRARECTDREKDWLNYCFLLIPLINVTLPLIWKSFSFVYTADCIALAAVYYWKIYMPEQAASSEQ